MHDGNGTFITSLLIFHPSQPSWNPPNNNVFLLWRMDEWLYNGVLGVGGMHNMWEQEKIAEGFGMPFIYPSCKMPGKINVPTVWGDPLVLSFMDMSDKQQDVWRCGWYSYLYVIPRTKQDITLTVTVSLMFQFCVNNEMTRGGEDAIQELRLEDWLYASDLSWRGLSRWTLTPIPQVKKQAGYNQHLTRTRLLDMLPLPACGCMPWLVGGCGCEKLFFWLCNKWE